MSKKFKFTFLDTPRWSPRGDKIAFVGFLREPTGAKNEIFTVKTNGTRLTEITHDRISPGIRSLSWAPDGRRIAFDRGSWEEWNQDLFIVDTISGKIKRLTQTKWESEYSPSFSPDGRKIAYWTLSNKLFIMDLESSVHTEIPLPDRLDVRYSRVSWSINGNQIVFDAVEGRDWNIYLYDLRTDEIKKILRSPEIEMDPDWWRGYTAVKPLNLLNTLWSLIKRGEVKR